MKTVFFPFPLTSSNVAVIEAEITLLFAVVAFKLTGFVNNEVIK